MKSDKAAAAASLSNLWFLFSALLKIMHVGETFDSQLFQLKKLALVCIIS
jgi:hypothetical protein